MYYKLLLMSIINITSYRPGVPFLGKVMDVIVHKGGKAVFGAMQEKAPSLTPFAVGIGFQGVKLQYGKQADEIVRTPWAVHYRDGIDLMPVYDIEFAFPIDIDKPIVAVKAIRAVLKITKDLASGGKYYYTMTGNGECM